MLRLNNSLNNSRLSRLTSTATTLCIVFAARVAADWFDQKFPTRVNLVLGLGAIVACMWFSSRFANHRIERSVGFAGFAFGALLFADQLSHKLVRVIFIVGMPIATLGLMAAFVLLARRGALSSSWAPSQPLHEHGSMFAPGRQSEWMSRMSVAVMLGGILAGVIFEVLLLKS